MVSESRYLREKDGHRRFMTNRLEERAKRFPETSEFNQWPALCLAFAGRALRIVIENEIKATIVTQSSGVLLGDFCAASSRLPPTPGSSSHDRGGRNFLNYP